MDQIATRIDGTGCYPNIVRILKARIITDIVSFYDGLVTSRGAGRQPGDGRPHSGLIFKRVLEK
jgi:hypothetical protein